MGDKMENRCRLNEAMKVFWIFILGSLAGYILEMIVAFVQNGYFESRQGVIYGPFTPVYGIGAVLYYLFFKKLKTRNRVKVFFITMVLGGMVEYLCSLLQEKLFDTVSWDYSNLWFNINGRTSLLHCIYWGVAGVLYTYLEPYINNLGNVFTQNNFKVLTTTFVVFMAFNITISYMAACRQTERNNNIPAQDQIDAFLDRHYPDEYMDKIFANKKIVH